MRSLLFLVNERARDGKVLPRLERLLQHAPLRDVATRTVRFVDDEGVLRGLEQLASGTVPVAVGGDGTVTSIARVLRQEGLADRPMAILPLGTGNGVAHSLGISSPSRAAQALVHGEPRPIDIMVTTHADWPLSLLSVSVGLEALIMSDFERWRRRSRGLSALVSWARRALPRVSGVTMTADGQRILGPEDVFYNAGLYNMPCYGFGVRPKPEADPLDGTADLRIHRFGVTYWSYMAAGVLRSASPFARHPRWPKVRTATIETTMPVQMDGETAAPASFDIEVVPGGLTVLARPTPESSGRPGPGLGSPYGVAAGSEAT